MSEWQERLAERLMAARGKRPVDTLFRGGQVVDVFSGELISTPVAVFDGIVVSFEAHTAKELVDLQGAVLSPGFIDGHIHLESSLLLPAEFARAVLPRGTTTVVADPHEIANVSGLAGIQFMLDASESIGLEVYFMAPSCVPATPMETAGAELSVDALETLGAHPRILGLAEMMNFPGVVNGDSAILEKLERFRDKIIDGHAPGLTGAQLDAYLCGGMGSDHECTQLAEAREKLTKGMHIMLREGSQARDLRVLADLVTMRNAHRCMLVSDDCHPEELHEHGHIDRILTQAMTLGIDPLTAVQLVTINPARYFGLRSLGAIAPGYQADFVVLHSLQPLRIGQVYKKGELVAQQGRCMLAETSFAGVTELVSMNLKKMSEEDFRIPALSSRARAIRLGPNTLITAEEIVNVPQRDGEAISDPDRDLLKLAVLERHLGSGRKGLGYVRGFGLKEGALASTVAHDSHNLVVVGASDLDMAVAANRTRELGGGLVVVSNGQVRAQLPLPVAGLMSDIALAQVVELKKLVDLAAQTMGASLEQPFMALSFLALPVIPKLKLTDLGLVDVESFTHVPLFV